MQAENQQRAPVARESRKGSDQLSTTLHPTMISGDAQISNDTTLLVYRRLNAR
jgi:hypothetical protein